MTPEELAEGFLWVGKKFYSKASIFTRLFRNLSHPLLYFLTSWGLRNGFENKKGEDYLAHAVEPSISPLSSVPEEASGLAGSSDQKQVDKKQGK